MNANLAPWGCSTKKLHFFGWRVPRFACQTVRCTPAPPIDKQSVAPLDVATFLCCTPPWLALSARGEGWAWWLVLVACLILVFLLLSVLRRRLVQPMDHKPSDTTDAWAEAGRRLSVKPDDQNEQDSQAEDTG